MEDDSADELDCQAESRGAHLARPALRVLQYLAAQARPPLVGVFGWRGVKELMVIVKGTFAACRACGVDPERSTHCLHFRSDEANAILALNEGDARFNDPLRPMRRRARDRHKPRNWRPFAIKLVGTRDGTRDAWQEHVAAMVRDGSEGYGLVVHVAGGNATDIRGDLQIMTPVIGPTTSIAICNMDTVGPRGAFEHMRQREGWDGVVIANVGVLQRRGAPKE